MKKDKKDIKKIVLRFADVTEPETPEIKTYVLRPTVLLSSITGIPS